MDTPHFFSDCVADMEGDDSYGTAPGFDRDDRVPDPPAASTYQQGFSYQDNSTTIPAPPPSLSHTYPPAGDAWDHPRHPPGPTGETRSQVISYFDSVPRSKGTLAIPRDVPGNLSITPSTRSPSRAQSSTASIPRTNSNSTTATTVTPIRPFGQPQLPPPLPAAPAVKKRKGRTRRTSTAVEEEAKRNRFLERNRVAASRCRLKKKEYVSDLEDQRMGLESKHTLLQMEHDSLVEEISRIKAMLMEHASCSDPNIDKWMENEARKFVQGASTHLDQTQQMYGQAPDGRHLSTTSAGSAASSYPAPSYDDPNRRSSATFSHTSSLQTSPVITQFPFMPPQRQQQQQQQQPQQPPQPGESVDFDHVPPDDPFSPLQHHFRSR